MAYLFSTRDLTFNMLKTAKYKGARQFMSWCEGFKTQKPANVAISGLFKAKPG